MKIAQERIVAPFEAEHPNIKIKIEAHSGDALDRDLKAAMTAGTGPDVFDHGNVISIIPFAQAGQVLDLTDFAQQNDWQSRVLPWAYKNAFFQGKIYALPTNFESLHLWYNQDLFDKYGWKVPTTYDELMQLCADIQAQGLIPIAFGNADCKVCNEWWFSYATNAYVGPDKMYKILTGETPWTDPDMVTAFEMLKAMWDKGYIMDKKIAASGFNEAWGIWGDQKAVLRVEGTWGFGFVDNYAKDFKYGVARLPVWNPNIKDYMPMGIGEVLAVNAHSQHPEEAKTFINWFTEDPKRAAQWASEGMWATHVPPLHMTAADFPADANPVEEKITLDMIEAMATLHHGFLAWSGFPPKTDAYMWNNFEAMLDGSLSINDYLAEAQKIFDQEKADNSLIPIQAPQ